MLIEIHHADVAVADKVVLSDIEFRISEGEFVYLVGKVGSGKSSFLKTLYGELPVAGRGEATVIDMNLYKLRQRQIPLLRRRLGIVFQDFQLLSDRTVASNIDFVLKSTGWRKKSLREQRIRDVLEEVGLSDKANAFPHQLSGGEQQRISLARAIVNHPQVVLADEPTGNLDSDNSARIMGILKNACEKGTAVVMVTHNLNLIQQYPGIVYRCEDGHVVEATEEYNAPIDMA